MNKFVVIIYMGGISYSSFYKGRRSETSLGYEHRPFYDIFPTKTRSFWSSRQLLVRLIPGLFDYPPYFGRHVRGGLLLSSVSGSEGVDSHVRKYRCCSTGHLPVPQIQRLGVPYTHYLLYLNKYLQNTNLFLHSSTHISIHIHFSTLLIKYDSKGTLKERK